MFGLFGKRRSTTVDVTPEPAPAPRPNMPTVRADPERVTKAAEANIAATIAGIPEIPPDAQHEALVIAVEAMCRGGDLDSLSEGLRGLLGEGVTKARISTICHDISRRSTGKITRERQAALGITKAKWMYSGAPCYAARKPTDEDEARDTAHRAADGKSFEVAKGMKIDGKYVLPGQEPGCRCVSTSIIPGFS
jgi:uncharacterized protein with gpF-like domain